MEERQWHTLSIHETEDLIDTDIDQGLREETAKERIEQHGKNVLPEPKKDPKWLKFVRQFNDVLIYVLLAAAVIKVVLGHWYDSIVIALVVLIIGIIGYLQENKAEQALEGIKNMLSPSALVRRDSKRKEIEAEYLVPGDIVYLKPGDKIPADLRLITVENMKVEESALTGEAITVDKTLDPLEEKIGLGDRTNLAFSGTSVAAGTGSGIVIATGSKTELGKINASIAEVEKVQTPLIQQTQRFGKTIASVIAGVAVFTFIFGYFLRDYETTELLLAVIGLSVAVIPEGLPAIISIILALGVRQMADNKAIVKNLPSVETLGAVSVICSDKTGTLTKNEMTAQNIQLADRTLRVTGSGYAPEGRIEFENDVYSNKQDEILNEILLAGVTCNDSDLFFDEESKQWMITGDPTEGCLLTLGEKAEESIRPLRVISKIPFDSAHKYMATLSPRDEAHVMYLKGAPDRLFSMAEASDSNFPTEMWEEKMTDLAKKGQRVIGVAKRTFNTSKEKIDHDDLYEGIEFLGLIGIMDPPRPEAIEAVNECQSAGIQVKMITGDHKDTAIAIGNELGIPTEAGALQGTEIDDLTDEELVEVVGQYNIFARTSPENKTRLVKALQTQDHIVAMTGDGVNDAPALRRADIGVAMGIKGTEVSKEAAEMVLVDDNFNTIFKAVKEGRRVYDNLKKTILFILPTNGAQGLLLLMSIFLGTQLPLTALQILWVNMVVAITLSFAIAFEPLEPSTMQRAPRPKKTPLLNGYYIFRILLVSLLISGGTLMYNLYMNTGDYSVEYIHTMTLNTIVFAQLFHLFNVRVELEPALSRSFFENPIAFYVSGVLIALQLFITYVPFMNTAFGTMPIAATDWLIPIALGIIVFFIIELEKLISRNLIRRNQS
ncbi:MULTISPECIES: cation-transporting P-type ATPase [unclassified Exiguobacterium]|uniref:cation-transporting P-type ATPase n=1 Tax=unclassified Exiguobacterium TaxID=2644629 RepID=UPI00103FA4F6|nr:MULTISPECIES: cation-transporting P-type ATPase [unclassified Exiguobacterium]TCI71379.1 cation-transporting P-type ATPase [Exiguobacterium sp. IPCI3]TCI81357.1 cation-transporting P-type ATPase [Exiguobacterium sp. IPCH1]TCI82554.1 cation-transporting P-type ATPase [Exiguobacterium sp. IPBC4]